MAIGSKQDLSGNLFSNHSVAYKRATFLFFEIYKSTLGKKWKELKKASSFTLLRVVVFIILSGLCYELRMSKCMRRRLRRRKVREHSGKLTGPGQISSLPGNDVLRHELVIFRAYIKSSRPLGFVDFAAGSVKTATNVLNLLSITKVTILNSKING